MPAGCRHPPPYSTRGKAGRNNLSEEKIIPLLPTGIGERFSQAISNLGHAALLRRCKESFELTRWPLVDSVYSEMLPAYGYIAGGTGLHEAEGGGQEAHLQHPPERASKYYASGIFSRRVNLCIAKNQYWKFETNMIRKGNTWPQSQFPHSCVWGIYIFPCSICLFCYRKYVYRCWEYIIAHRNMNVELRTEAAQFSEKENINGIFFAVCATYITKVLGAWGCYK